MACAPVPAAVACTRKTVGFCESPVLRRCMIILLLFFSLNTITYYSFLFLLLLLLRSVAVQRTQTDRLYFLYSTSLPSFNFKRVLLRMGRTVVFFLLLLVAQDGKGRETLLSRCESSAQKSARRDSVGNGASHHHTRVSIEFVDNGMRCERVGETEFNRVGSANGQEGASRGGG